MFSKRPKYRRQTSSVTLSGLVIGGINEEEEEDAQSDLKSASSLSTLSTVFTVENESSYIWTLKPLVRRFCKIFVFVNADATISEYLKYCPILFADKLRNVAKLDR